MSVTKPLPPKDGEGPLPPPYSPPVASVLGFALVIAIALTVFTVWAGNDTNERLKEQFAEERTSFRQEIAQFLDVEKERDELKAKLDHIEEAKKSDEAELLARLRRERENTSLVCKLEVIAWQARIEGAAGVPEGTFKQMYDAIKAGQPTRASNAQLIALLDATDKWAPPACAGMSL